jgi:hypothetical protein
MALDKKTLDHLRRERNWYLACVAEVRAGTYPVECRVHGEVIDERAETLERFGRIVENIDEILHSANIDGPSPSAAEVQAKDKRARMTRKAAKHTVSAPETSS